jgi:hypothetical protein
MSNLPYGLEFAGAADDIPIPEGRFPNRPRNDRTYVLRRFGNRRSVGVIRENHASRLRCSVGSE